MKKTLALFVAGSIAIAAIAQEKKEKNSTPPPAVKSAFEKAYPNAGKTKWSKEGADGYEAEFKQNNKEITVVYTSKGVLTETEEEIAVTALPAAITSYVTQHYKGASIKEAAKITKPDGTVTYEAEVNETDLLFDASGKFLKADKD